ncbi:MAG: bacteriohemerythrin [Deltaproteobacteria bacterium]|nr:bacteriohemerythrin [Deltaproteobacteria bacterium]
MSLQWTKALSVGISEIDDQHKELFGKINKMLNIIVESSEIDETGKVIDFLDEYVVSHFATEEGLMKRFDYPDLEYHLQQHGEFTREFYLFRERCRKEGPSRFLAIQIEEMMVEWWTNHINKVDKVLGSFLMDKL